MNNGHARRLDRVVARLSPVRPSPEVLEREYDRLIAAYKAHQAGERSVSLTSKWPISDMDRWVAELIEEANP